MKKYFIVFLAICILVVSAIIGSYVFAIGAFLFKVMIGVIAIVIFIIGFLVGRFLFPCEKN
ncbi:MAG: hypothetical protein WC466_05725 [Candidatus Izemoplasmatales bacterium]